MRWTTLALACALLAACDLGVHDIVDTGETPGGPSDGCSGACHGQGDSVAPPRDTSGRSDLASIGVGAHKAHLQASDWHQRFACETCHKVPTQVGELGHMFSLGADGATVRDPLPAELTMSGLGTSAQWDHASATCTNSYCHGDTLHQVDPATSMIVMGAGGTNTKPVWNVVDGTQSACGTCHGNPPPAPHPQNSDCGLCHQSMNPGDFAAGKFSYAELHINGKVEVTSTQACDSCHGSAGQSAPPRDAHGNTATSAPGVGAHAQHLVGSSSWHAKIECNECHLVPGSTTDQTHLDTRNEVYLDPTTSIPGAPTGTGGRLQIAGATYNAATMTCTSTFCHGGGQSPLLGGSKTSPLWTKVDGTQVTCGSCHGTPPPSPHPQGGNIHDCGSCHPTMPTAQNVVASSTSATITISLPAQHVDGDVQVVNDRPCNDCHGNKTATPVAGDNKVNAPPLDTTGGSSTTLRTVGAHQPHLGTSTWRAPIACAACHRVPATMQSIGHIDTPTPAELTFGTIAGATASWNGSTCSNVYCHGATLKNTNGSAAGGTATKPVWTVVDGSQSQCGSCHGEPPPPPHINDPDCGKCHGPTMTEGQPGVITNPLTHIDGALNVNTDRPCNSCHGSAGTPASNSAPLNAPPKDNAGNTATNTRGVGAHQAHLAPATPIGKLVVCADCHVVPSAVGSVGHVDTPLPADLTFSARAGTAPTWNGAQCGNTYCHGATLTQPNGSGAGGTATSPSWTKVDGTQKACTSCHGNPPPLPHLQRSDCQTCHLDMSSPTTFADVTKHIDGNLDVNSNQACNACHGDHGTPTTVVTDPKNAPPFDSAGTGNATTLRAIGAHQKHLVPTGTAWRAAITCDQCHRVPTSVGSVGHIDTALPAELTFTGGAAGTTWNGSTCSSYCHGTTLPNAGGAVPNPLWTKVDGTQAQCNSCHGDPPTNAPHNGSTNCGPTCHPNATNNTINPAMAAMHINGTVDVTAGANHPTGYEMVTMHGYEVDKTGTSSCATAGCHGVTLTGGTTGGPSCATVNGCHDKVGGGFTWQTQCTFCHGDITVPSGNGAPPQGVLGGTAATDKTVGAHQSHLAATAMHGAWDCIMCHTKPSNATTPGHIDGTGGVVQAEVKYSTLNPSGTFNATTATCASLYCHGNGRTSAGTAVWTTTTKLTCTSCHASPAPGASANGMSGEHDKHIRDKKYKCVTCHATVVDATPTIIAPALHVNGAKDIKMSQGTYNPANKACSGLGNGCHGTKTW